MVRWAFLLFVGSMAFEDIDIGFGGMLSISRLVGVMVFLIAMFHWQVCLRRLPIVFWLFVAYVVILTLRGVYVSPDYQRKVWLRVAQQAQLVVSFWIAYNVFHEVRIVRQVLLTIGIAAVTVFVLSRVGIGSTEVEDISGFTRIEVFEQNLNTTGRFYALGLTAMLGFSTVLPARASLRVLSWSSMVILAAGLVDTGSRGAQVSFAAGLCFWTWAGIRSAKRWVLVLTGVVVVGMLMVLIMQSAITGGRWAKTFTEKDLSSRDVIARAALAQFLKHPFLGAGPEANVVETGETLGMNRFDTHNMFLWCLTEVGLIGSLPVFIAFGICLRNAVRSRRSAMGGLMLMFMVILLLNNLSGSDHNWKYQWIILAMVSGVSHTELTARNSLSATQRRRSQKRDVLLSRKKADTVS